MPRSTPPQTGQPGLRKNACFCIVRVVRLNESRRPPSAGSAWPVSKLSASAPIRLARRPAPKTSFLVVPGVGLHLVGLPFLCKPRLRIPRAGDHAHAVAHEAGPIRCVERGPRDDFGSLKLAGYPADTSRAAGLVQLEGEIEHAGIEARNDEVGAIDGGGDILIGRWLRRHRIGGDFRRGFTDTAAKASARRRPTSARLKAGDR